MQFKKGDLVLYKYPDHELGGVIGIIMKDTGDYYCTKVHFANVIKYKTRYILNEALKRASK